MSDLKKLDYNSKAADIAPVLAKIANGKSFEYVELFQKTPDTPENAPLRNILAAGLTGLVLGGELMSCEITEGPRPYRVDPFLNQLRNAMLRTPAVHQMTQENARLYIFYPEFAVGNASVRERVVRAALAHSSMSPKNDQFVPLYSLGGLFDAKTTEAGIPKSFGRGTTCVMTARAVYHAAGAEMIGQRLPGVNTPHGPDVDLGVPARKVVGIDPKTHQNRYGLDPEVDREKFDDLNVAPPPLSPGDIYFIAGHGPFAYLLRPESINAEGKGGDLAGHVGIVTIRNGFTYWTVDGGAASGNEIEVKGPRDIKFVKDVGWTLGSVSYSGAQLLEVKVEIAKYAANEAVETWINTNAAGVNQRANLAAAKRNLELVKNNPALLPAKQKSYDDVIAAGRRLIKIQAGNKVKGTPRTVQGWWTPSQYQQMRVATVEDVNNRIARMQWFSPELRQRYSPMEAISI